MFVVSMVTFYPVDVTGHLFHLFSIYFIYLLLLLFFDESFYLHALHPFVLLPPYKAGVLFIASSL